MATEPDVLWDRDELVLVLKMYHTKRTTPSAIQLTTLSRELRDYVSRRDGETLLPKIRSTSGIQYKLDALEALKNKMEPERGGSELLTEVWEEFGMDRKRVWDEAKRIRDEWDASVAR